MSAKRPSFISEHTAEFCLVPRFQSILKAKFSNTVPFFFWSTREGNSNSRNNRTRRPARLCALFPRRPKLGENCALVMKVNKEVFRMAVELQQAGIPPFAGIPLVHSLFELAEDCDCLWFYLGATGQCEKDIEIDCEGSVGLPGDGTLRGPCRAKEVCHIVETQSQARHWQDAIEILRYVRSRTGAASSYRLPFGLVYKPVYFLVW